jgi:hypothetical protein
MGQYRAAQNIPQSHAKRSYRIPCGTKITGRFRRVAPVRRVPRDSLLSFGQKAFSPRVGRLVVMPTLPTLPEAPKFVTSSSFRSRSAGA